MNMLRKYDFIKFGILVGLSAILLNTSFIYGLWESQYSINLFAEVFLLVSVFIVGSLLFGIGLRQGFGITISYVLLLQVYNFLVPGSGVFLLSSSIWMTGFNFMSVFAAYLMSFWIYEKSKNFYIRKNFVGITNVTNVLFALSSALIMVSADLIISHSLLSNHFLGLGFIAQHLLITFIFVFVWRTYVGFDKWSIVSGALILGMFWTTYSVSVGYTDLWFRYMPAVFISSLAGFWSVDQLLFVRINRPLKILLFSVFAVAILSLVSFSSNNSESENFNRAKALDASGAERSIMMASPVENNVDTVSPLHHRMYISLFILLLMSFYFGWISFSKHGKNIG